jgi:hypothetical protein
MCVGREEFLVRKRRGNNFYRYLLTSFLTVSRAR